MTPLQLKENNVEKVSDIYQWGEEKKHTVEGSLA